MTLSRGAIKFHAWSRNAARRVISHVVATGFIDLHRGIMSIDLLRTGRDRMTSDIYEKSLPSPTRYIIQEESEYSLLLNTDIASRRKREKQYVAIRITASRWFIPSRPVRDTLGNPFGWIWQNPCLNMGRPIFWSTRRILGQHNWKIQFRIHRFVCIDQRIRSPVSKQEYSPLDATEWVPRCTPSKLCVNRREGNENNLFPSCL